MVCTKNQIDLRSLRHLKAALLKEAQQPKIAPPKQPQQPKAVPPKETQQPKAVPPKETQQPKAVPPKETQQPKTAPLKEVQQPKTAPPKQAQQPKAVPPKETQQPKTAPLKEAQQLEGKKPKGAPQGGTPPSKGSPPKKQPDKGAVAKKPIESAAIPIPTVSFFTGKELQPVKRPDLGGKNGTKIKLRANFFPLKFREDADIYHYDIELKPDIASKSRVKEIVMKFIAENKGAGMIFHNVYPVFDGRKNIYTARDLHISGKLEFQVNGDRRPVAVFIQFARRISLYALNEFLQGRSRELPHDAVTALDIVLRQTLTFSHVNVGRSFYNRPTGPMGVGLELWSGHYQSVRPTRWKIVMLQVDTSVRVFHKGQHVLDLLAEFFGARSQNDLRPNYSEYEWGSFLNHIKGLQVETTHVPDMKRSYKILNLSSKDASKLTFPLSKEDGSTVTTTIADYFMNQYNLRLRYPQFPCLQAQPLDKHRYLPMEVCVVKKGQQLKKLTDEMTSQMIRFSAVPAPVRERTTKEIANSLNIDRDVYAKEFGVTMTPRMVEFDGRVLQAPCMVYSENKAVRPRDGSWNMMQAKFYTSASIEKMAVVAQKRCFRDAIQNFLKALCGEATKLNMKLPIPEGDLIAFFQDERDVENLLLKFGRIPGVRLIIVIMPDRKLNVLYGAIKRVGDTELGVATQCVLTKNVLKCNQQTMVNICMKINVKLGCVNTIIQTRSSVLSKPIMIMGADVTHPSPGDFFKPSIAAVTASYDAMACKYAARISVQDHRVEVISDLQDITKSLLLNFYNMTKGRQPVQIIFYRDGVSEGQFREVLAQELTSIQKACYGLSVDYQPEITFIVVQKRHHTRLYCAEKKDESGRAGNVPPGTTVDTDITHPIEFDFYLCSHQGIQGTSRPAHYHVLYDDHNFTSDALQELSYQLCHVYARCTRSVSIPAPVYYAHHCAFRGRYYLDSLQRGGGELNPEDAAARQQMLQAMNRKCVIHADFNGMFFA